MTIGRESSPGCDRELRRELRALATPIDVSARVLERVERVGGVRLSRRPRSVPSGARALAAALALAGLGVWSLRPWESGIVRPAPIAAGVTSGTIGAGLMGTPVMADAGRDRAPLAGSGTGARPRVLAPAALSLGSTKAYDATGSGVGGGMVSASEVTDVGAMAHRPPTREELLAWAEAQRKRSTWMSWLLPAPVPVDEREPVVARHKSEK